MKPTLMMLAIVSLGLMLPAKTVLSQEAVLSVERDSAPALDLSERMRGFLKFEMRALVEAGRAIEAAIEAEDHATIAARAAQMDKAFIMSGDVTTLDLRELEAVLGEDFIKQDKSFHALARTLQATAKAKDLKGERIVFDQMLRACAACHKAYAPEAPVLE